MPAISFKRYRTSESRSAIFCALVMVSSFEFDGAGTVAVLVAATANTGEVDPGRPRQFPH